MKKTTMREALPLVRTEGRRFFDEAEGVLYSDYTLGAWSFCFKGTALYVNFTAIPDMFNPPPPPGFPAREKKPEFPWIAVFLDGSEEPVLKQGLKQEEEQVCILNAEQEETHSVKIVKLTENFRTQLGIRSFEYEGELLPAEEDTREGIEFIGDSITCGFGNDLKGENGPDFNAAEEDGYMAYGAITARALGLKPRFMCVSGIAVQKPESLFMQGFYGIEQLYPCRDMVLEDRLSEKRGTKIEQYEPYDFSEEPVRYVVVNLGTNDGNQVYFAPDKEAAEQNFKAHYTALIRQIRALNGPDADIILSLGCMDYYLFDIIRDVADELRREGDERIHCLKFGKMMMFGPDAGGAGHPSIHRHKIMAKELIAKIRSL